MKKGLVILLFSLFFLHIVSAQVLLEGQPKEIYNLGDSVTIPVSIKAITDIRGSFEMKIICGGLEQVFYKNGITLAYGEEVKLSPAPKVVLTKEVIGDLKGSCKITAAIGAEEPVVTDEFRISTLLDSETTIEQTQLNPGEDLIIEGTAVRESGTPVDGFAEITVGIGNNSVISQITPITKGYFKLNATLDNGLASGTYSVRMHLYEKNSLDEITNQVTSFQEIFINQVPNNLEIIVPNEIKPGTDLEIKTVLHDQTGINIPSLITLIIQDSEGKKIEETSINTEEIFKFPIPHNQAPKDLIISAKSIEFSENINVTILENPDIKIELINDTVLITNIGNVPYCNESVLVKIGNESVDVDVCIEVDENQEFEITAPKGEYLVEVINNGESKASENIMLTGGAIDVKAARSSVITLMRHPIVWIFIIGILGFMAFMVFKKGYKRSFFGYIKEKATKRKKSSLPKESEESILNLDGKKAEISLSMKGEKHKATILDLRIKNLKELKRNKEAVADTMKKLSALATEHKTAIYENQDHLFFIFSPVRTKTFKNQKPALELAQTIKNLFEGHNKLFKQRIDFGISINDGEIMSKMEGEVLKFMSIKDALSGAKKISDYSQSKIIITEPVSRALSSEVKTQKHIKNNLVFYTIVKYKNSEEHQKFIRNFLKSIERKPKEE